MSFASTTKNKEVAYITQILSIFGVVEARQMRALFSNLSNERYGKIIYRLKREGLLSFEYSGKYLVANKRALQKREVEDSVKTFWVFISMKDKLLDFCESEEPTLITVSAGKHKTDYDLIPVREDKLAATNSAAASTPADVKRLLVVSQIESIDKLDFRPENDFVAVVTEKGEVSILKM